MRSKTLYKIKTKKESFKEAMNSKDIAEKILKDHEIRPGVRQIAKLSGWIARANGKRVDDIHNCREYDGSLNIPPNLEIELPEERNGILYIISDGKIMNQDLLRTVDIKIKRNKEQQTASCFNYANGGVRYDFEIREYRGRQRVMFRKDYGGWTEFSKGKFVHLNGKWESGKGKNCHKEMDEKDPKKIKSITISERESSFEDAGIEITKIAACNSRVICYGKEKGEEGRHRFFWAQLEDSFPGEPGGVKLPGVYVASADGREQEALDRNEYVMHLYDTKMRKHPAWIMQVLGGRIGQIMAATQRVTDVVKNKLKQLHSTIKDIEVKVESKIEEAKEAFKSEFGVAPDMIVESDRKIVSEKFDCLIEQDEELNGQQSKAKELFSAIGKYLPKVMPVVVDNVRWYEISIPLAENMEIDTVLDIGVSDIERYEHYKTEHGGEVQCWLYDQKLEEYKEKLSILDIPRLLTFNPLARISKELSAKATKDFCNAVMNHLAPNTKVHDGMGFNDGTCNFFFLAKMRENQSDDFKNTYPTYSVFWCDEQEGFSEQWRNIHPDDIEYKSAIGNLSIFPCINWYYNFFSEIYHLEIFNIDVKMEQFNKNFKNNLPYDKIDDESRMAVGKNPILFTTKECIHSISYMWGVTDFRWNTRSYPEDGIIFPSSIKIRDDNTIYLAGFYYDKECDEYINGYFFQKYIPQSLYKNNLAQKNYSSTPFEHKWYFVSEACFNSVDRYYNFLIYDAYDQENWLNTGYQPHRKGIIDCYGFRGVDERAQYYIVETDFWKSDELNRIVQEGREVWVSQEKVKPINPFYATIDPNHKVKVDEDDLKDIGKRYKEEREAMLDLSIKLTLRWDNVLEKVVAIYTNPCDDDIPFHMDKDKRLSENVDSSRGQKVNDFLQAEKNGGSTLGKVLGFTSDNKIQYYNFINYDLKGRWACNKGSFKLYFKKWIRCYSSPAVKKVELELLEENKVAVRITTKDISIRYVTIGAIVDGRPRRVSQRYELSKEQLYNFSLVPGTPTTTKDLVELEIPLLKLDEELKIKRKKLEEYFYRDGQIKHGTSVWFEDILGHKCIAEEFEIKGKYWKTLGKIYFNPDSIQFRGSREEGIMDEEPDEKKAQEERLNQIKEEIVNKINNEITHNGKSKTRVKIVGHCASINEPANEDVLSKLRSEKIYEIITDHVKGKGIPGSFDINQYEYEWRGARDPANSNSTAEGMKSNRRVVVMMLMDK